MSQYLTLQLDESPGLENMAQFLCYVRFVKTGKSFKFNYFFYFHSVYFTFEPMIDDAYFESQCLKSPDISKRIFDQ